MLSIGHHLGIAVSSLVFAHSNVVGPTSFMSFSSGGSFRENWDILLAFSLFFLGSASIYYSVSLTFYSGYVLLFDESTLIALCVHHQWIGGLFLVGAFTHFAIAVVRIDWHTLVLDIFNVLSMNSDIILGHLSWVVTFLGINAFGLYVHNDTLLALNRIPDTFSDAAIASTPLLSALSLSTKAIVSSAGLLVYNIKLSTSDFLVTHIHSFTIHTTVLILLKGALVSRSSRLVPDKATLGFRYPCDGPGRGGTCQISAWDHTFLGLFWMYNSISIVVFHLFWEIKSSLASNVQNTGYVSDFFTNGTCVNGWLGLLWSGSSKLMQAYGSSYSVYTIFFLLSHFIWALSLMFLFSGRGYWQELLEVILWSHVKLYIVPLIKPRALSITSGRGVGVTHYIVGGIGSTWSFVCSGL